MTRQTDTNVVAGRGATIEHDEDGDEDMRGRKAQVGAQGVQADGNDA